MEEARGAGQEEIAPWSNRDGPSVQGLWLPAPWKELRSSLCTGAGGGGGGSQVKGRGKQGVGREGISA